MISPLEHWHMNSDVRRSVAWDNDVIEREAMRKFANGFPMLGLAVLGVTLGFVACDGDCTYHEWLHQNWHPCPLEFGGLFDTGEGLSPEDIEWMNAPMGPYSAGDG